MDSFITDVIYFTIILKRQRTTAGADVLNSAKCKIAERGEIEYRAFIFHPRSGFLFEWNSLLLGFIVEIKEEKERKERKNILRLRLLKVVYQRAFRSAV